MHAVVRSQHVVAEIVRRVPPRRMNVVAVSLGVVVLDEQRRSLDAEVMPLPRFGAPRPGEGEAIETSACEAVQLGPARLARQPPRDRPPQGRERINLPLGQRSTRDTLRTRPNVAE